MPRSMWKGNVSFGLVSIPVRLYVATESHGVSFNQICPEHNSRIRYKRWCEQGDHEIAYGEIAKGYEVGRDRYVLIDERDLDNIPLPTSHTIEIQEFVPSDGIQGELYFKSAYYLEPDEAGRKPYALLKEALADTGRTAVAKIALRDREHLCALSPVDGMLLLNTLHWPDEIRSTEGISGLESEAKVNPKELAMAKTLIENLAEDRFDPAEFHDEYHDALMKVVEAKVQGEELIEAPHVDAEPRVMDLMDALKASVDAARKQRDEKKSARGATRPARKKAS
jgi:DNA end-binding protein Ku